eukprot:TRINITY_DN7278_c0_g1_i1.p1 TRINITY_DN7278_c0_g1~~TRINITY_DN7278_c0_g1_i1.p1  ORF type:complete len:551 (+),score=75.02 TRINITY_DN7278_c0_g1_i1:1317-2969(+)
MGHIPLPNPPSLVESGPFRFLIFDAPNEDNLPLYINELKRHNIKHLVRACDPTYGIEPLRSAGIEVHDMPFPDGGFPTDSIVGEWLRLLENIKTSNGDEGSSGGGKSTVGVHCLSTDHQILTNRGFMFLHQIQQAEPGLLVASYQPETGHLVYEPFTLVLNPEFKQTMIEFSSKEERNRWEDKSDCYGHSEFSSASPSNYMSVVVTPKHDMYCANGDSNFVKVHAEDLLTNEDKNFTFLAHASSGVLQDSSVVLPFVTELGLASEKENSFLELYAYWIGCGTLEFNQGSPFAIQFSINKERDFEWMEGHFNTLNLIENEHWNTNNDNIYITEDRWVKFFFDAYENDYKTNTDTSFEKGLLEWVWKLNKNQLRALFRGLSRSCGKETVIGNTIYTPSAKLRDDLVTLSLHAGYAVNFEHERDTKQVWSVSYTSSTQWTQPNIHSKSDVCSVEYTGSTWCVRVPSGFIVARRAHAVNDIITKASKPIIMGNCVAGLGRAPVLVAIALIEGGMQPLQAIEFIRERRRGSINMKQLQYLKQYKRKGKRGPCSIM